MKKKREKNIILGAALALLAVSVVLSGCTKKNTKTSGTEENGDTRTVVDAADRQVEIPQTVESVVCLNVGALRYTCYMQAQDLVIGVEDYEKEQSISRPYNYVNYDLFEDLPVVGNNGEHYPEEILSVNPDVIVMTGSDAAEAEDLEQATGIPVVLIPGSDNMMDEDAYDTFLILGEVYGREERADELLEYMDQTKADLITRTESVAEEEKPSVYVGGVSYKGAHGFEGTEALYGPFAAIGAKNLADETGQNGPFNIDLEQVLAWNPDVLFVDFNGLDLIKEDCAKNPGYYQQLKAVQEGKVYSQISFRSSASNLDTALADTYYAGTVLYPEQFADIDPAEKADEIFTILLGEAFYGTLKENGYEFRQITLSEE